MTAATLGEAAISTAVELTSVLGGTAGAMLSSALELIVANVSGYFAAGNVTPASLGRPGLSRKV